MLGSSDDTSTTKHMLRVGLGAECLSCVTTDASEEPWGEAKVTHVWDSLHGLRDAVQGIGGPRV